jgi:hypothetical protein
MMAAIFLIQDSVHNLLIIIGVKVEVVIFMELQWENANK